MKITRNYKFQEASMRKFFLGSVVITALLLVLIATGCPNPSSNHWYQTKGYSIGTPDVNGKAYPGVNRVTWLPVSDAKAYDLIRKDNSDGSVKILVRNKTGIPTSLTDKFYYDDVVADDNQLLNDHTYTYTVIAYSGLSFNGRSYTLGTPAGGTNPVPNTKASVDITANIPSPIGENAYVITPPKAEKIVLTTTKSIDKPEEEFLDIRWPAIPTFGYRVKYTLGDAKALGTGNIGNITASLSQTYIPDLLTGEDANVFGHIRFPLIAGTNTVQIEAFFLTGDRSSIPAIENDYYLKGAPVDVPAKFDRQVYVPTVNPGFDVAQYNDGTNPQNGAVLTWTNVPEATGYSVYKLGVLYALTAGGTLATNTAIVLNDGVWTALDISKAVRDGDDWSLTDTAVEYGKKYTYLFVVNYGEKSSLPVLSDITTSVIEGQTFEAPALASRFINTSTVDANQVELYWEARPGETYLVTRQEISFDPEYNTYAELTDAVSDGEFTIVGSPKNFTASTEYHVAGLYVQLDDKPDYFKSYRYELRAQKGGLTSKPTTKFVYEGPYNKITNLTLTTATTSNTPAIDYTEKTIGVTVASGAYAGHFGTNMVKLFRKATSTTGGDTDYTAIKTFTAAELVDGSELYVDKGLDRSKQYKYKVVAYNGTTALADNSPTDNELTAAVTPSALAAVTGASRLTPAPGAGISGTTLKVSLTGINLKDAGITVRRYRGASAPAASAAPENTRTLTAQWNAANNRYELLITGLDPLPYAGPDSYWFDIYADSTPASNTGWQKLGLGD
jgi:hypothetical protein